MLLKNYLRQFLSYKCFETSFAYLWMLDDQQINHQIYLEFLDMTCLVMSFCLVVKNVIYILWLQSLNIPPYVYIELFFLRRLILFKKGLPHPSRLTGSQTPQQQLNSNQISVFYFLVYTFQ